MSTRHTLAVAALLAGLVGLAPLDRAAAASPPANDDPAGAAVISSVPFFDNSVDTSTATTSAEELALNDFCGAPAIINPVWYKATPLADQELVIDTRASGFNAGILILQGEPGSWTPVACGPGAVLGFAVAGVPYYVMVFGDGTGEPTSGPLVFEVREPVPAPEISLTVNPVGSVDKVGNATISGTVTCSSPDNEGFVFEVYGQMRQRIGRLYINGYFYSNPFTPCDGSTTAWSAVVTSDNGRFAGGKTATIALAFGCGTDLCSEGYVEATIQLRKGQVR